MLLRVCRGVEAQRGTAVLRGPSNIANESPSTFQPVSTFAPPPALEVARRVLRFTRSREERMTQMRKIPAEAVELYTQFIHGEISRRDFLHGVERFAIVGLSAAAIVEALMPNYALGQQVRKDDERIKASYETVPSPDGLGYIKGYFVRPFSQDTRSAQPTKLPGVIVIHENRGLNPHTEDVARRFALENFIAFAPDALSSVGGYPGDDLRGGELFGKLDANKRLTDFVNAAKWLKARPECSGKIAA